MEDLTNNFTKSWLGASISLKIHKQKKKNDLGIMFCTVWPITTSDASNIIVIVTITLSRLSLIWRNVMKKVKIETGILKISNSLESDKDINKGT